MKILINLLSILFISAQLMAHQPTDGKRLIQIAILLDTSNSMDGLIDQAKAQLWNIANEITNAEQDGKTVDFQFALYEYGNDNIPEYKNHVRKVVGFTEDMDLISSHLFALKTRGGQEYCGQVIHNSISELEWRKDAGMKAIYIAGNESFAQGNFPYAVSCKEAKNKDIVINTIFCGDFEQGINLKWNDGSSLSLGTYNHINQNSETVHFDTPYDDDISMLNQKLNETYISFSEEGRRYKLNQSTQDLNAGQYGRANAAKRAIFKSKSNYKNESWDVIDAEKAGKDIFQYNDKLPESLKSTSKKELLEKISELGKTRASIQADISCLAKEREAYLEKMRKEASIENPFEASILNSLRKQLLSSGFKIKK